MTCFLGRGGGGGFHVGLADIRSDDDDDDAIAKRERAKKTSSDIQSLSYFTRNELRQASGCSSMGLTCRSRMSSSSMTVIAPTLFLFFLSPLLSEYNMDVLDSGYTGRE